MTTRPLTGGERRTLEGLRSPSSGGSPFAAFMAFCIVLAAALVLAPGSWEHGARSLLPVGLAVSAAALAWVRTARADAREPWYSEMEQDLEGGLVEITRYRISEVVAVEEFEDEGSQYWALLEDGRVAFLAGQYLYEVEERQRFPSTVVTITRALRTRVVLGVDCEGDPVPVRGRTPPFTMEDHREGRVPEDGAIVHVDFRSLTHPFDRAND